MSIGSIGWKGAYTALKNYAGVAKGYAKRAGNMYGDFVFGTGNEIMAREMKNVIKNTPKGSWWKTRWDAFKAGALKAEKHSAAMKAANGGFFKNMWKSIKSFGPDIAKSTKVGARAAKIAGKSQILGSLKGVCKGIGKKLPLIGSLLLVAFEIPNIVKATANEGLVAGAGEVVKAGARLGGATLGAAIGTACLGPLGGIVGWCVGEWVAGKLVGKSYTERKMEDEQKIAQAVEAAKAETQTTTNPAAGTDVAYAGAGMTPTLSEADFLALQEALYGTKGNIFERDFMPCPNFYQQTKAQQGAA